MNRKAYLAINIATLILLGTFLIVLPKAASETLINTSSTDSTEVQDAYSQGETIYTEVFIDPDLKQYMSNISDQDIIDVIISFRDNTYKDNYQRIINLLDPNLYVFKELPMISAKLPKWFISHLANDKSGAIISIYLNKKLEYFLRESVEVIGAPFVWNGVNAPATCGAGQFTVVVLDSGVDQTHPDLKKALVANIKIVGNAFINMTGLNTDTTSGHGTHVAGIIAGRGDASNGYYRGVAPCAKLIGLGAGETLFILFALQGFDWILQNKDKYNIRVVSNSWGTTATNIDPFDPINLASFEAYKRGIVVVFAAGNSGPGLDTLNKYSIVPWVIGVAAGTKEKELAYFSSRGVPGNIFKKPTITAPGVDIVATRDSTIGITATDRNVNPVDPTYTLYYTSLSGTSMATPHVSGVVALMLSVNPLLSPDQVKNILISTADPMPGYGDFEVGAGYLNAQKAVSTAASTKGNLPTWKPSWTPDKLAEWVFGKTVYTGELLPSQRIFQGIAPPGERLLGILSSPGPKHIVNISPFYSIVPIKVRAELSWTVAACDLDLAIYNPKGQLIAYAGASILQFESIEFFVNNVFGNYTFEVVVFLCPVPTPYTLNVTIFYGNPQLLKIIPPKPIQQPPNFDIYVTTPRIFKVYDGIGIASTYYIWGDQAFIDFTAFYSNGTPAPRLSLTVNIIHESGAFIRSFPAIDRGGGAYRVVLPTFDPSWISGKYRIEVSGSYKMVADKSVFYLNNLEIFLRPHTRVTTTGSFITLYLRSVTFNDVGVNRIFTEPVAVIYKIYINGSLTDFAIDTILNGWIVIQLRLPDQAGFYIITIVGTYSEPITNIPWSGNEVSWVFLTTK